MRKKLVASAAVALLAAGTLAGCGSQTSSADAKTIKIGVDFELTGAEASFGSSALKGVQLAVDQLNKNGGVLGKTIEIVKADNASKADEATREAQKLINSDKV